MDQSSVCVKSLRRASLVMLLAAGNVSAEVAPRPVDDRASKEPESQPSATWKVATAPRAIEQVRSVLGIAGAKSFQTKARLAVVASDRTPYLSEQIVGRTAWRVTLEDWKIVLSSEPALRDRFSRTLDVFVDPIHGRLLKLETQWPQGEPPIRPHPTAESATWQMWNSGREVYHGFPAAPPKVTLQQALTAIREQGGGNPTVARQIIGHYVVWSMKGISEEPRPVWAIMLWGIPPQLPFRADSKEPRFRMRYIIDAATGKYILRINTPGPDGRDGTGE